MDLQRHDCVFINGECPVVTAPDERLMQKLKIKLLTFRGEWFHNTLYGVPYWQDILGKKSTKSRIDVIFQEAILEEEGVLEIVSFQSSLQSRVYSLSVKIRAKSSEGVTTVSTLSLGEINV